ncbi:MAG TPA: pyridoxamine 5'-phosphate oxidase [Ohtaekwangia sp.]
MQHNLANIRKEYSKLSLDVSNVNSDPVNQFQIWFDEAVKAEIVEPTAMNLSTVRDDGRPASRIVLLKGIEEHKFVFYTNYQSAKGHDLDKNPACALTFFWPELERQVRIEGVATRVSTNRSEAYFKSRPRGSQIGAWSSPQSSILENRGVLEERVAQMEKKFESYEVLPRPHQWGGYEVTPLLVEFWQGRQSRLHDRIQFVKIDDAWKIHRLAP